MNLKIVILYFLMTWLSCMEVNKTKSNDMDVENLVLQGSVVLFFEKANNLSSTYRYYINKKYIGDDEEGFQVFMKLFQSGKNITKLIVKSGLTGSTGGRSSYENLPFYSYKNGYEELSAFCTSKNIVVEFSSQ